MAEVTVTVEKIGYEDLNTGTGTFSRTTSTGGTQTMTKVPPLLDIADAPITLAEVANADLTALHTYIGGLTDATPTADKLAIRDAEGVCEKAELAMTGYDSETSANLNTTMDAITVSENDVLDVEAYLGITTSGESDTVRLSLSKTAGDTAAIKFVHSQTTLSVDQRVNASRIASIHIRAKAIVTTGGSLRLVAAVTGATLPVSATNEISACWLKKVR